MPGAMQTEQEPTPPTPPTAKPVHPQYPVDMRGRTKDDLNRLGEPLGSTTEIANISGATHVVLTNEGTIDGAELARLKEEMLHGNGFIIAKGVVPPELCKTCCDDLLSRGQDARRTSDILKYVSRLWAPASCLCCVGACGYSALSHRSKLSDTGGTLIVAPQVQRRFLRSSGAHVGSARPAHGGYHGPALLPERLHQQQPPAW
jgi:hypothetical protein